MKFNADRKIMSQHLKTMIKTVPRSNPIQELRGFLIEADEDDGYVCVTASSPESAIQRKLRASVEVGGSCVIDARALTNVLGVFAGDDVSFEETKPGTVEVKSGTCIYTLPSQDGKQYPRPQMPFPNSVVKVSGLRSMYAKTSGVAATGEVPQALSGIHIDITPQGFRTIGTNRGAVAIASREMPCGGSLKFTLSKQVFANLANAAGNDELQAGVIGAHAVFMKEGMLFSAKRLPGEYVDVDTLINAVKPALMAKVELADLKDALLDICGVASAGGEASYVKLDFRENAVELSTQNAVSGGSRAVGCVLIEGESGMSFHYSAGDIKAALKVVEGTLVLCLDERGYLLVLDKENKYMMIPVSQHAVRKKEEAFKAKRLKHRAGQKAA